LRKYWFHILLLILIATPIIMLGVLDYYNLEGYNYRYNRDVNGFQPWHDTFFDQNFTFDLTWKGRMFYSIFIWFMVIETAFGWQDLMDKKPQNRKLMAAALIIAAIPTIYVLAVNFFGLDLSVLKAGLSLNIPAVTASNDPSDFLHLQWPLSLEYMVLFSCSLAAVAVAYKGKGIKTLGISLTFLGAMAVAYMLDTVFPFGVFKPLQELALPTTATTAALFDFLGYGVTMMYPMHSTNTLLPALTITSGAKSAGVEIAWACAGVYSLLLYVLIILVFFKRTNISSFRKVLYFFIGLFGTFFANVMRIYTIIIIDLQSGHTAMMDFHNTWGELFGFGFIFGFIMLIVCIERFSLVERTRNSYHKVTAKFSKPSNPTLASQQSKPATS
jgi:thaumarchaeosortase